MMIMTNHNTKLKNRYFGVAIVNVVNSMLNADFDHLPPRTYHDIFRASGFSFKYGMKRYYEILDNPVLGLKQYKLLKGKLVPKTIDEIFTDDTNIALKKGYRRQKSSRKTVQLHGCKADRNSFPC